MSAQLDMSLPPLTALALHRASGPSLSSGMGYTKTPFLTKFLETVTYAPFCALFAAGTVYVKDNTTVVKVQPYFSSDPNEAVNQCNASKAGIAPIVKDSYVFKKGESENHNCHDGRPHR